MRHSLLSCIYGCLCSDRAVSVSACLLPALAEARHCCRRQSRGVGFFMPWNDESWRLCLYSLEASPSQAPGLTPKRLRGSLIRLIRPIGGRNADGFAGRSRGSKTSHRPGRRSRGRSPTRPRQSLETTLLRSTHAWVTFTAIPGTSPRRHLRQPSPTSRGASKHARQTRIERPKSALTHAIIVKDARRYLIA